MKLVLKNNTHNTQLIVGAFTRKTVIEGKVAFIIGNTTYNKIRRKLCGIKKCECELTHTDSEGHLKVINNQKLIVTNEVAA